jgi:hypothetical protein
MDCHLRSGIDKIWWCLILEADEQDLGTGYDKNFRIFWIELEASMHIDTIVKYHLNLVF